MKMTIESWFASKEDTGNSDGDVHDSLAVYVNIHMRIDPLGVIGKDEKDEQNEDAID